jgi:hypothetical protein
MTGGERAPIRGYAKPVVLPEQLSLLRGPVTGIVELPAHLKWSGSRLYDLGSPGRIVDLYRTVINEAASPSDLYTFLNVAALTELWPSMWLPAQVRRAWEDRFAELRVRRHPAA